MRKRILLLIVVIMLSMSLVPINASEISGKKNELNSAKQDIKQAKNTLDNTKEQKEAVSQELEALDKNITKIEDEILSVEADLVLKKEEVEIAQAELSSAIEKKDHQYEATKKRMVQMYKNNKSGYLELIFSADNIWEALNRAHYIKVISQHDNQLLDEYEMQEQIIADKKLKLEQEQRNIEALRQKELTKKSELEVARKEKNKKLGVLENKEDALYAQIEELEEVSKDLEKQIKKLTEQSTQKYNGGRFAWPVPGNYRLSSEYNPRESPITGKNEFHQGIDIPAGYGKAVVAAADGIVITSGWVRGFGNTIMIDHGSGLVTIYGHNSSLTASTGQKISKGQQVAKIGSTGYSTGNHCHFEVRINGKHTNPWKYLNK
ncbi:MAG: peptidoglycan DD-metalloendopeptidase family protein [Cellulosilyticaceae bacterium]